MFSRIMIRWQARGRRNRGFRRGMDQRAYDLLLGDQIAFNIHLILAGQVHGEDPDLYLIYPQGNPLRATTDSPYLQVGETKYGRPILDRGLRYETTTLEEAAKYALISLDSTMRSNVTVGPPIDLLVYAAGDLRIRRYRRFNAEDPDLRTVHSQWEHALRKVVQELPAVRFPEAGSACTPLDGTVSVKRTSG